MYRINTANGDIHRDDGFIITAPYDEPEYLEYATWVQEGNSPVEFFEQPLAPVPESITRFQARAALYEAGHLDAAEAYIADPSTPILVKMAWQDAQEFKRASPAIAAVANVLNLSNDQIDTLFRAAGQIEA
jgi:hypothetical protein